MCVLMRPLAHWARAACPVAACLQLVAIVWTGARLVAQVVRGFSLPFPLNIILMPLRVAEWLVFFLVSYAT